MYTILRQTEEEPACTAPRFGLPNSVPRPLLACKTATTASTRTTTPHTFTYVLLAAAQEHDLHVIYPALPCLFLHIGVQMKSNVLLYGHLLKSDFSGHDIEYESDLGIFVGPSNQYQPVPSDHLNVLHDSTVISAKDGDNLFSLSAATCANATDFPNIYNCKVLSPSASTTVCGQSIASWQAKGKLKNVTTGSLPTDATTIVQMARNTLGMRNT